MNEWLKTYRLAIQGVALAALVALGLYWHHRIYESGVNAVKQADAAALDAARTAAKIESDRLAKTAQDASHAHDKELADLRYYRATHPVHVGVCGNANHSLPGVPGSTEAHSGHAGSGSPSGNVQPLPSGDSGSDDIGPMLELLAGRGDKLSAQLREYQQR
jgi:hypothetical protein